MEWLYYVLAQYKEEFCTNSNNYAKCVALEVGNSSCGGRTEDQRDSCLGWGR